MQSTSGGQRSCSRRVSAFGRGYAAPAHRCAAAIFPGHANIGLYGVKRERASRQIRALQLGLLRTAFTASYVVYRYHRVIDAMPDYWQHIRTVIHRVWRLGE